MTGQSATIRAPCKKDPSRRRHRRALLVLLPAVLMMALASADTPPAAGLYDIESYTMMPHLDEMRRITKSEQLCVGEGDVTNLFPVMRQTAFRGCALLPRGNDEAEYDLRCQTDLVATGLAVLYDDSGAITGTLAVKMGGKNMTFSQHTTARYVGRCGDATPAAD